MLHFLLNLCAFCRLASRLAWDRRPCPAPAPAPAQTAPARPAGETASRHGTRAARPAAYRRRRTTRPAPRPDGHAAPMPSTCPPRSNSQSQPETVRTSEEGEEEHEGRKGEKMRTCARLPAVLPSKSYIDRTPPPNGQPSTAPGQQAPQPAPAEAPSLPTFSRPFPSLQFCFWRVCRTPARFRPSADEQRHPARLPGRHRHRGSLHIFAPAPFLTKRLSTSTLSRTPHIPIFHSGTISTIPQQ